jgi:hypothetical protein
VQKACDRMRFIADVTIEDNTVLSPNQAFRKTWRIQNSGSCTWSPGYRLIFDSGDPIVRTGIREYTAIRLAGSNN